MCREKPETGPSLESTSVNMAIRGAIEAKVYVIFKMVYMEKSHLENNHGEIMIGETPRRKLY